MKIYEILLNLIGIGNPTFAIISMSSHLYNCTIVICDIYVEENRLVWSLKWTFTEILNQKEQR